VVGRTQLARLLQLILALRAGRYPNARDLAEVCEVSRRTIYRDLETLEVAGVPVRYVAERQGYELAVGFAFEPPRLTEAEAQALLILSKRQGGDDRFGLHREAKTGAWKMLHALSGDGRARVQALAEQVEVRAEPVAAPAERTAVYETILQALADHRQVRLWYHEPDGQTTITTKFSPYRLVQARTSWWLIGRSTLHRNVETIPVSRIVRVLATEDFATIPPRFSLERYLGRAWDVERGLTDFQVHLRFSRSQADFIQDAVWHPTQRLEPLEDGRLDLFISIEGLDEIVSWILSFGDSVEVLAPVELRTRLAEVASRLASRYAADL
jgi:predicted DNA-binding transcriptional regulator YafY